MGRARTSSAEERRYRTPATASTTLNPAFPYAGLQDEDQPAARSGQRCAPGGSEGGDALIRATGAAHFTSSSRQSTCRDSAHPRMVLFTWGALASTTSPVWGGRNCLSGRWGLFRWVRGDRKSTRLNSRHVAISYAV